MSSRDAPSLPMSKAREAGDACACFHLRKAARAVTQLYDEVLRSSGLRATQFTLLMGIRLLGPVTVMRLAERTVTDPTTLTRNLRVLEKRGLIRIERGDEDRRERVVTLSREGERALADAFPLWKKAQTHIAQRLGEDRLRRMLRDLSVSVESAQP